MRAFLRPDANAKDVNAMKASAIAMGITGAGKADAASQKGRHCVGRKAKLPTTPKWRSVACRPF
jgi:hypothetical protein